ncbi:hypothetical protein [Pseudaminobacter sp. NGMCC 1.201702]|uniref:hypothetical protein n=1 Tax=Pseudaminobacter sp. NGMCC 1.201702 TaxID=3391825 RepID=UPI0039EE65E3
MSQADSPLTVVRILVPGCGGDPEALSQIFGSLTARDLNVHAGGPDLVRTGDFVDESEREEKEDANAVILGTEYTSISLVDFKLDKDQLVGQRVAVKGRMQLVGEMGVLDDPYQILMQHRLVSM